MTNGSSRSTVHTLNERHENLLRRLAVNDDTAVESVLRMHLANSGESCLDSKTSALVRLAGLIALQSPRPTYGWGIDAAIAAGASDDDIVGVLVAVAPVVGVARVNRASASIAANLGYDIDLPDWD
jgi:alkylhydroperoxidase/carboxymuconolactone decarboxylase family protein YurZ